MERKLYRDEYHKKIAGVCAGLAEYFSVDVAIVRVLFVLALILHGGGLLVYIILWIALPKKLYGFNDPTVDYKVPPQTPGGEFKDTYQNNPYGGNPWKGNPWNDNPFGGNPFPREPYTAMPPRSRSTTGLIFGLVLIVLGASLLINEFDLIPYWDMAQLWPCLLVVIGGALIFSGQQKKPWQKDDWHKTDNKDNDIKADDASAEGPSADNTTV